MAQQSITLKIAGKSYSLSIESEKEESYRLAEREVNKYLTSLKQNNFKNWTEQDYLSMTALKFAISNVDLRQSREVSSDEQKRLGALDEQIDTYLNSLKG
ncbi:MAG: cell division protein ZapA [Alistipes sp.]